MRRVCVVTATRAEYGLLWSLLDELRRDPDVELQLVVTGTHLSERYGRSVEQIERDGFPIAARVPLPLDDDSVQGVTRALAAATSALGEAYAALQPDLLVLLGDRYEVLAAAQAAMVARVPIAHVHGGEATEGLMDEAIRHAVTKMSHLHFVAAEDFRRRVIQLGEAPSRVWTVGATGLDNIARLALLDRGALEAELGFRFDAPSFLVTYHPVTLSRDDQGASMQRLLEAIDAIGGRALLTGVNADTGGHAIRRVAEDYAARAPERFHLVETLGVLRYLSAMAQVDAVLGNSSSGLIEAPAMGKPVLDIGDRQRGRPRAPAVVHCEDDAASIAAGLQTVLSPRQREIARRRETSYGLPGAAKKIAGVIRAHPLEGLLLKRFHDLPQAAA